MLVALVSIASAGLSSLTADFLRAPSPAGARESLAFITSRDHLAGSPGDYTMARYVRDKLRGFGLQAEIEEFAALPG